MSDLFKYDTGLPEGPGVLTNARFERDPAFNDGQTLLLRADLVLDDSADQGEVEVLWKCGEKFETVDDGATAQRIDGRDKLFHQNTGIAKFGMSMLACDGAEDVIRERYAKDGLTPLHAAYYEGLKFNFINQEYSAKINGDDVTWNVLEVDEFLGVEGGGRKAATKPAKAAAKAPAKKAAAKKEAAVEDAQDAGIADEVRDRVFAIAYDAADEESYVAEALEEFGDQMTPELEALITDTGAGSVWAAAVEKFNQDNS